MSKFYDAVADWLREQGFLVDNITNVEQETEQYGFCETCWHEEVTIVIHYNYTDEDGFHNEIHTYSGGMASFVEQLL